MDRERVLITHFYVWGFRNSPYISVSSKDGVPRTMGTRWANTTGPRRPWAHRNTRFIHLPWFSWFVSNVLSCLHFYKQLWRLGPVLLSAPVEVPCVNIFFIGHLLLCQYGLWILCLIKQPQKYIYYFSMGVSFSLGGFPCYNVCLLRRPYNP